MKLIDLLLRLPRGQKRAIQVLIDCILIIFCYFLAMFLRLDTWANTFNIQSWYILVPVIPITLAVFINRGFYRAVLRYIGSHAFFTVLAGVFTSALIMFVVSQLFGWYLPRSVPAIYALLAIAFIGGTRLVWRIIYIQHNAAPRSAVVIYGAGSAGRQVLASLRSGKKYSPILFLDDDPTLHGSTISSLRVFPTSALKGLIEHQNIEIVLLAMPQLSRTERQTILTRLEKLPVQVQTIPDIGDLVSGQATLDDIRDVAVEDLLGRDPIPPRPELMAADIAGKSVLVSGAGGSIGSELCRQIISLSPTRLVLLEQSEFNLYRIEQELVDVLTTTGASVDLRPVLGSVQHPARMQTILSKFGIDTIYHAAAYKHVPLVEENCVEGIRNNIFGTLTLAEAAIEAQVSAFILISTDKAVRPTNVMGASKRMAELICQALSKRQEHTRFSMVRFGNVLGSSGSVIPRFRKQIAQGGPVTVTDRNITRYFMTIPEAAQLVIQAGAMTKGGEVFVLDMGEPVQILNLASRMISLSGFTPRLQVSETSTRTNKDIDIVFTGLRPGEKLYEELLIADTSRPTAHPRILSANEVSLDWDALNVLLEDMLQAANRQDVEQIKQLLVKGQTQYQPTEAIRAAPANETQA